MAHSTDEKQYLRRRRIVALISLAVVLALATWLTLFFVRKFSAFGSDPEKFKAFIEGYGWKGWLVALGIQILQVVISLIPGEVVEVGMGYAFGWLGGTALCLLGVGLASAVVFLLVRRWGIRMVELFIPREKIDQLRFFNSEQRLKRTVFLLFFIPGTPKDLFTYFIGLTRIRLHEFLIITLIARIPSVVSSTIGGNLIQGQSYGSAVILFAITGAVSLTGIFIYNRLVTLWNRRKEEKAMAAEK